MTERYLDENGYLRIDRNPVSKAGIYLYYGQEINLPERAAPYRVLRSPEVLAAAVNLFNGASIRIEHKFLGNVEGTIPLDKEPDDGVMINPVFDNETLYTDLIVKTQRGINFINETTVRRALEGKKPAVSMGYSARYAIQQGEWNGQAFDAVMVSIESGNHLALLAGDGRIDDAAFIKDNAAEQSPNFDFKILTKRGDDMADKPLPQIMPDNDEAAEARIQALEERLEHLSEEHGQMMGTLQQILTKIAEAEGKATSAPATAPETEIKDENPENFPIENEAMNPIDESENKAAKVEDHAAMIAEWTGAHEIVKPYLGVCTPHAFPTAKELFKAACDKVKVIAGTDPKAQFMAYLAGKTNQQPITSYGLPSVKVADGKAKSGEIPLTRAELSAADWSE